MNIADKWKSNNYNTVLMTASLKQQSIRDNTHILPSGRQRYTLQELVAQCDASAPAIHEEDVWGPDAPMGNEIR
ncbi:antitoxin ChpS [Enterobacter sp.]|uniref:antitoxin ChpS n=1 Tax=Enterobacter sp. TaxID=42895 RepID=UPI0029700100|nr:antitoxin ChpS [Enterobacter sp.]